VTGGAGFIGSHLVAALATQGGRVRVIEKPGVSVAHLPNLVDVVFADITAAAAITAALRDATHVVHLAADPNLWHRRRGHFLAVNFQGTVNVLKAAETHGARRIVHGSSESILTRSIQSTAITHDQCVPIQDVIGPYCRSKWLAERFAMRRAAAGVPITVVNPTLPIGPGDRTGTPPTRMIRDVLAGKSPAFVDAELNLIDVRDVALGIERALMIGDIGRRYLLGAEAWTVRQIFDTLTDVTGRPRVRRRVPYWAALGIAYISEIIADAFTHQSPAATVTGVRLTRRRMTFDAAPSLAALGITPRPVLAALYEMVVEAGRRAIR
jgi:dihydroflavonol-4-reductase